MPNECQMSQYMVRQAHHDLRVKHFQTVILSLSKDGFWISFELDSPLVHHFVRNLAFDILSYSLASNILDCPMEPSDHLFLTQSPYHLVDGRTDCLTG